MNRAVWIALGAVFLSLITVFIALGAAAAAKRKAAQDGGSGADGGAADGGCA